MGCSASSVSETEETSSQWSRTTISAKDLPLRKLYQLKEVHEEGLNDEENNSTNKDNNTKAFPLLTSMGNSLLPNADHTMRSSRSNSITSVKSCEQSTKTVSPSSSLQSRNSLMKSKESPKITEISFPEEKSVNDDKEINLPHAQKGDEVADNVSKELPKDSEDQPSIIKVQTKEVKDEENAPPKTNQPHAPNGLENPQLDGKFHPQLVENDSSESSEHHHFPGRETLQLDGKFHPELIDNHNADGQTNLKSESLENDHESSPRKPLDGLTDPRIDGKFHPKLVGIPSSETKLKDSENHETIIIFPQSETTEELQTKSEGLLRGSETHEENSEKFPTLHNLAEVTAARNENSEDERMLLKDIIPPSDTKQQSDYINFYENIGRTNSEISFDGLLSECESLEDLPCSLAASSSGLIMPRPITSKKRKPTIQSNTENQNEIVIMENPFKHLACQESDFATVEGDSKDNISECETREPVDFQEFSSKEKDDQSLSEEKKGTKGFVDSPELLYNSVQENNLLMEGTMVEGNDEQNHDEDTASITKSSSKLHEESNKQLNDFESPNEISDTSKDGETESLTQTECFKKTDSKVHVKVIRFNLPDSPETIDGPEQKDNSVFTYEERDVVDNYRTSDLLCETNLKPLESDLSTNSCNFNGQQKQEELENNEGDKIAKGEIESKIISPNIYELDEIIPKPTIPLMQTYNFEIDKNNETENDHIIAKTNAVSETDTELITNSNYDKNVSLQNDYINLENRDIIPKENILVSRAPSTDIKENSKVIERVNYHIEKIVPKKSSFSEKLASVNNNGSEFLLNV